MGGGSVKILVTGGNGQLGRALAHTVKQADTMLTVDIDQLDVTCAANVEQVISEFQPDAVIHGAAYTNVDLAESDRDKAYRLNVIGTQNIASACLRHNAKLVYVSTDFVFDGAKQEPYVEFDSPNPASIYGKTKWEGELLAARICPRLFIARTAWLYGDGHNFVRTILRLTREQDCLRVVNDQTGTPTNANDLAAALLRLIKTEAYGTYHMSNNGQCTWYDFACAIARIKQIKTQIVPVTTADFPRPAPRPAYSVLRNYMLELTIGDQFRPWDEALAEYLQTEEQ